MKKIEAIIRPFKLEDVKIALVNLGIVITATRMKISYEIKRGILGTRGIELLWTVLPFGLTVAIIWISFRV